MAEEGSGVPPSTTARHRTRAFFNSFLCTYPVCELCVFSGSGDTSLFFERWSVAHGALVDVVDVVPRAAAAPPGMGAAQPGGGAWLMAGSCGTCRAKAS